MTFYWIIWRPRNGDPMGITLFKLEKEAIIFNCNLDCMIEKVVLNKNFELRIC